MSKSTTRNYEVLSYGEKGNSKLTVKQYLVYSYLMSLSKWDAQRREYHYYVYKNQFKVKDACEYLGISQPTWRNAINKLIDLNYIREDTENKSYIIRLITPYAPLDINLIKDLVAAGIRIEAINKCGVGGNIVSVFSLIYEYCRRCGGTCEININQLKKIYTSARTKEATIAYRFMLGYFHSSGLMNINFITRTIAGTPYTSYIIKDVKTELPKGVNDEIAPEDIEDIFEKLQVESLDEFGPDI